ncbi:hypothetical protein PTTG_09016 [Puccinia triticina 1-1 BBBD Race 1]|uniref:Uncharacterized protein n=1 Tax=Puccinia triticina (isolate 1-1 / race 1 (BBBD)) TaxID=630390 RepID=A0A180FZN3_PUCT1|nr:hypothetical protein PTTG_09016 [Puccinia triticina 1-1 BBBD Race 1]
MANHPRSLSANPAILLLSHSAAARNPANKYNNNTPTLAHMATLPSTLSTDHQLLIDQLLHRFWCFSKHALPRRISETEQTNHITVKFFKIMILHAAGGYITQTSENQNHTLRKPKVTIIPAPFTGGGGGVCGTL